MTVPAEMRSTVDSAHILKPTSEWTRFAKSFADLRRAYFWKKIPQFSLQRSWTYYVMRTIVVIVALGGTVEVFRISRENRFPVEMFPLTSFLPIIALISALVVAPLAAIVLAMLANSRSSTHTSSKEASAVSDKGAFARTYTTSSARSRSVPAIQYPVAVPRRSQMPPKPLKEEVLSQWVRLRSWAEESTHGRMLWNRTAAAAAFISDEIRNQVRARAVAENGDDSLRIANALMSYEAESRLLFRVDRDGIIVEIKRLPLSQPAILVQSFVERSRHMNPDSYCFEIVARTVAGSSAVMYSYATYRALYGPLPKYVRPIVQEMLFLLNGVPNTQTARPLRAYRCKNFVTRHRSPPIDQIL